MQSHRGVPNQEWGAVYMFRKDYVRQVIERGQRSMSVESTDEAYQVVEFGLGGEYSHQLSAPEEIRLWPLLFRPDRDEEPA